MQFMSSSVSRKCGTSSRAAFATLALDSGTAISGSRVRLRRFPDAEILTFDQNDVEEAQEPVKEGGVTLYPDASVTLAPGVVPFCWNWGQSDRKHTENTASTLRTLPEFALCLGL